MKKVYCYRYDEGGDTVVLIFDLSGRGGARYLRSGLIASASVSGQASEESGWTAEAD